MTVLHHLQDQAGRHSKRSNQRDVDAAPDHHDGHRKTENAEDRDILNQRQNVFRC